MLRLMSALCAGFFVLVVSVPAGAADRTLVVFPFTVPATVTGINGTEMTDRIAAEVAALGGVRIVKGSTTAKPDEYRAEARAVGSDLYFTGSVVQVFSSYSAILQLVTTRGGTVIWSTTMNFRNVADIKGEGSRIHDEVLRGATPRPYVESPPPAPPTPAPATTPRSAPTPAAKGGHRPRRCR